MKSTGKYNSGR